MIRVLIVNPDGLLSALPTLQEYGDNEYVTDVKVGLVDVSQENADLAQQNAGQVKVLMPGLPGPDKREKWLYMAVVKGELLGAEEQSPNIRIHKSGFFDKLF